MAKAKLEKTLVDYVGIAFTPVLIMLLVGSLVFFLLELTYSGQFETRLRWILFWFVFASVLIGRIAIEQGRTYAAAFSLALAGATALVILRFVDGAIVALGLLGIVWWCTNKLTWDCTMIDDSEDASGEGLLQAAGIEEQLAADRLEHQPDVIAEAESQAEPELPWWQRWMTDREDGKKKPHAPGIWVIYFSLAVLPIFGIGQLFIPASDAASRSFAFQLLWVYVASALGLLLMTSFLGLRRYLRQRRLQMPASMTGRWIAMGSALAIAILLLCIVLPRPDGDYSVMAAIDSLGEKTQEAWDKAFLDDAAGEGDGQRSGQPQDSDIQNTGEGQQSKDDSGSKPGDQGNPQDGPHDDAQPGDKKDNAASGKGSKQQEQQASNGQGSRQGSQSKSGESSNQNTGSKKNNSDKSDSGTDGDGKGSDGESSREHRGENGSEKSDAADNEGDEKDTDENEAAAGGESAEQDTAQPSAPEASDSSSFNFGDSIGTIVKWFIYLAFALFVLYLVVRNWDRLVEAWRQFLQGLFGRAESQAEEEAAADQPVVAKPLPFAAFENPFLSRGGEKKSPAELLQYTFEALQAWATEHKLGRSPDQTPLEFADRLSERVKPIANEVQQTGQLYASLAYAGRKPSRDCLPILQRIWKHLQQNTATVAVG